MTVTDAVLRVQRGGMRRRAAFAMHAVARGLG
jgi:hypothetical protein